MTMGDQIDVTTVTHMASMDSLSESDYREIYDEIRGFDEVTGKYSVSLDDFVVWIDSRFSKAAWSKYHRGDMALNRTMRNELRNAAGQPELPPTVAEAVEGVHADALVVQVGAGVPDRVVMVAGHDEPVMIAVNGTVRAWRGEVAASVRRVTSVTRSRKAVYVPVSVFDRLNALRRDSGLSWVEVLEAAERVLVAQK